MNEESLFAAALEKQDAAERQAFLDEACGGDVALRQRLEQLLAAHGQAAGILERGPEAAAMNLAQPEAPLAADRLFAGRFKLRQKLGAGGMGEVWVADQIEPVQRRVALKVVRPGFDSAGLLARFDQERQALALMDHPNIAKVLDAGATEGRPYFVMELIKGVPITRYCDEARLSPRDRLELFVSVCHAVQHAHQKGIIHRDLKPSNILVALYDGQPVPKVIDFGVAKATGPPLTEQSIYTEVGALIGTLEYMSPEQAELNNFDIDTRSDIYTLGVVLYELLTGAVPFSRQKLKAAALTEILRIIKEVDPPKPSTRLSESKDTLPSISAQRHMEPAKLTRLVRGELDWIVMKALEKDRNRRYETANGFAIDVLRYLNNEPVSAGPPSAGYRLRKYARKHVKVLATAAAFAAVLVAATVSSIVLASWALRERNHAQQERQAAEANLQRALKAVEQMLTRVAEVQLLNVPQMEPVRRQLLQDALRFYQEFLSERGDSPVIRSEAALAYRRMGMIQFQLGQPREAEESYRQAVGLAEKLFAEAPDDPAILDKLASIHNNLGGFYQATQRWPEAEENLKQAVALREQLDRLQPDYPRNRLNLAGTHANLVVLYRPMGRLEQAEAAFQKCKTLAEDLLRGDARNADCLHLLATCHQNVGLVYGAQDRIAEAEAAQQKALALYQQLLRDQPEVVDYQKKVAAVYNNLGLLYAREQNHAKAEAAYRQCLALHETIVRDHPKVVAFQVDLGASYGNMAVQARRSSPEESLKWSTRAIDTVGPVLEQDPGNGPARMTLFDAHMGRAITLLKLKRQADAAKDWKRTLELSAGQPHITLRLYRPSPLAHLGEHAQATAEMETLLAEGQVQPLNLYTFAYIYARCSAGVAKDARLPPVERQKLADKYGSRAVELLRKAQAASYFKNPDRLARMKTNDDLDAIRARSDFQKLLVELEAQMKK